MLVGARNLELGVLGLCGDVPGCFPGSLGSYLLQISKVSTRSMVVKPDRPKEVSTNIILSSILKYMILSNCIRNMGPSYW